MYKLMKPLFGEHPDIVKHLESGIFIPFDEANTDYQAFLAWKAEGNEPLPADEPEQS